MLSVVCQLADAGRSCGYRPPPRQSKASKKHLEQLRKRGTSAESMEGFRSVKFGLYEKSVRAVPVPCLKSLSRLLGNGPVDRLYDPNFLNPDREHGRFSTRTDQNASKQTLCKQWCGN